MKAYIGYQQNKKGNGVFTLHKHNIDYKKYFIYFFVFHKNIIFKNIYYSYSTFNKNYNGHSLN